MAVWWASSAPFLCLPPFSAEQSRLLMAVMHVYAPSLFLDCVLISYSKRFFHEGTFDRQFPLLNQSIAGIGAGMIPGAANTFAHFGRALPVHYGMKNSWQFVGITKHYLQNAFSAFAAHFRRELSARKLWIKPRQQRVETTSDNNYLIMDSWRKRNNLLAGGAFLVMFDALSGMRVKPNDWVASGAPSASPPESVASGRVFCVELGRFLRIPSLTSTNGTNSPVNPRLIPVTLITHDPDSLLFAELTDKKIETSKQQQQQRRNNV